MLPTICLYHKRGNVRIGVCPGKRESPQVEFSSNLQEPTRRHLSNECGKNINEKKEKKKTKNGSTRVPKGPPTDLKDHGENGRQKCYKRPNSRPNSRLSPIFPQFLAVAGSVGYRRLTSEVRAGAIPRVFPHPIAWETGKRPVGGCQPTAPSPQSGKLQPFSRELPGGKMWSRTTEDIIGKERLQ